MLLSLKFVIQTIFETIILLKAHKKLKSQYIHV